MMDIQKYIEKIKQNKKILLLHSSRLFLPLLIMYFFLPSTFFLASASPTSYVSKGTAEARNALVFEVFCSYGCGKTLKTK